VKEWRLGIGLSAFGYRLSAIGQQRLKMVIGHRLSAIGQQRLKS
jgi:hypothetical protein